MTTAQPGLCSRPPRPAGQLLAWQPDSEPSTAENMKAVVRKALAARSGLGGSESRHSPTGTDMLTSAFAESTRPPRPGAAAYPGPDGRRLLAVDLESSGGADGPSKAQVGASQRRSGPHARIVAEAQAGSAEAKR
jgi:hypothetical protein